MNGSGDGPRRGLFFSFEGVEGCGKSTQIALLAEVLASRGHAVLTTREPGGTPIGEAVRTVLLSPDHQGMTPLTEALLYAASRAQHVEQVILPALERGVIVLCDRYLDSSIAYQGYARELGSDTVLALNDFVDDRALPDRTFFLAVPVEEALARATSETADRIEQEALEFHLRVDAGYRELARKQTARILAVDGAREADAVHRQILADVERKLVLL